jgi:hypothetical protein
VIVSAETNRLTLRNCHCSVAELSMSTAPAHIGLKARLLKVISAGHAWCPRQDSNLRSRLRRPVEH